MTSLLLQDRVVIITGGSQGIGKGVALGCARAGARVVVHHLGTEGTLKDADELVKEIEELGENGGEVHQGKRAVQVGGDISKPETAEKVISDGITREKKTLLTLSPHYRSYKSPWKPSAGSTASFPTPGSAPSSPSWTFHTTFGRSREVSTSMERSTSSKVSSNVSWPRKAELTLRPRPLCAAVANQMKVQEPQGGSIVAVSSISALVGGGEQASVPSLARLAFGDQLADRGYPFTATTLRPKQGSNR
jgi:L-rhamnose 1-dehydrogenase